MDIHKTIYAIIGMMAAMTFAACTADDTADTKSNVKSGNAGLVIMPYIDGKPMNTLSDTRTTVASETSLNENWVDEMYLAIGIERTNETEDASHPEITDLSNKTGQYYVFRKLKNAITPEGMIMMVEGKDWMSTVTQVTGHSGESGIPLDVHVIANPRETFTETSGLGEVVSDLSKMLEYMKKPQSEETGDPAIYTKYTKDNKKNFLMYGYTTWTPRNANKYIDTIKVDLTRAAAKTVANIIVNSSEYKIISVR